MFVIIDPTLRQEAKSSGDVAVTVAYYEADGDAAADFYFNRVRRDAAGVVTRTAYSEWLAPYVVNWSGVVDRNGTAIEWPGPEAMPPKVATAEKPAATAAQISARAALLSRMPFDFLQQLDSLIGRTFMEGLAAGKG